MSQTAEGREKELVEAINRLCFPALNVVCAFDLDLEEHPNCPYKRFAKPAIDNLNELLEIANGGKKHG